MNDLGLSALVEAATSAYPDRRAKAADASYELRLYQSLRKSLNVSADLIRRNRGRGTKWRSLPADRDVFQYREPLESLLQQTVALMANAVSPFANLPTAITPLAAPYRIHCRELTRVARQLHDRLKALAIDIVVLLDPGSEQRSTTSEALTCPKVPQPLPTQRATVRGSETLHVLLQRAHAAAHLTSPFSGFIEAPPPINRLYQSYGPELRHLFEEFHQELGSLAAAVSQLAPD
jgi:hypothetical protein